MRSLSWLAIVVVIAMPLWAAEAQREWVFPALVYGPSQWSLIRVTNKSSEAVTLNVEAYTQSGEPIDLAPSVLVEAGKVTELRVQSSTGLAGFGWARVSGDKRQTRSVQVEAVTEYLLGDEIRFTRREKVELTTEQSRLIVPGASSFLYLLNAGTATLHARICWTDRLADRTCSFSNGKPARATIPARQTLFVALGKPRGRYLVTWLDERLPSALMFFDQTKGAVKTFSTESTLSFEEEPAGK